MSKSLRILVAHQVPSDRTGGMSRIMGFIHDHVVRAGHLVDYLCADALPPTLPGSLKRLAFPWWARRQAVLAARAGRPYDLINIHEPSSAPLGYAKAAAGNAVIVATSHGVEQRNWEQSLAERRIGLEGPRIRTRILHPLTLMQARAGLKRADHIFCLNTEDRDYLVNWLPYSRERITRIYPAANQIYAHQARSRDYRRCKLLLFAGTWIQRKGVADITQAFVNLASRHPELRLLVLGGGVSQEKVREGFPEYLRDRIACVQAADEAENAAAYAAADLFLLPSRFEGTPLTLIEAMMSGLPIITTGTCGMKDVIRDGKNGLLIPLYSPQAIVTSVERLISSESLRAYLGHTAQKDALRHYTWEKVAAPVLDIYEQLCVR